MLNFKKETVDGWVGGREHEILFFLFIFFLTQHLKLCIVYCSCVDEQDLLIIDPVISIKEAEHTYLSHMEKEVSSIYIIFVLSKSSFFQRYLVASKSRCVRYLFHSNIRFFVTFTLHHILLFDTWISLVSKKEIYIWPLIVVCIISNTFYNLLKSLLTVV